MSLRGYWRTERDRIDCRPAIRMTRFTTIARTGRRTKMSVSLPLLVLSVLFELLLLPVIHRPPTLSLPTWGEGNASSRAAPRSVAGGSHSSAAAAAFVRHRAGRPAPQLSSGFGAGLFDGCTALLTFTAAPFRSLKAPELTTSSPGAIPDATATWSPRVPPSLTNCWRTPR